MFTFLFESLNYFPHLKKNEMFNLYLVIFMSFDKSNALVSIVPNTCIPNGCYVFWFTLNISALC